MGLCPDVANNVDSDPHLNGDMESPQGVFSFFKISQHDGKLAISIRSFHVKFLNNVVYHTSKFLCPPAEIIRTKFATSGMKISFFYQAILVPDLCFYVKKKAKTTTKNYWKATTTNKRRKEKPQTSYRLFVFVSNSSSMSNIHNHLIEVQVSC